jgi:hypothetical protein
MYSFFEHYFTILVGKKLTVGQQRNLLKIKINILQRLVEIVNRYFIKRFIINP